MGTSAKIGNVANEGRCRQQWAITPTLGKCAVREGVTKRMPPPRHQLLGLATIKSMGLAT